jgi:hypothetical protein
MPQLWFPGETVSVPGLGEVQLACVAEGSQMVCFQQMIFVAYMRCKIKETATFSPKELPKDLRVVVLGPWMEVCGYTDAGDVKVATAGEYMHHV